MKTVMILFVMIFTAALSAQESKVPENVIRPFQVSHPKAQDVTWNVEGQNYEAHFTVHGNNNSVLIDTVGKILETESEIDVANLPSGVIKYLNDNYRGYTLAGTSKIVDDSGIVTYKAKMKDNNSNKIFDVMFTEDGKPLKPEGENDEAEGKEK